MREKIGKSIVERASVFGAKLQEELRQWDLHANDGTFEKVDATNAQSALRMSHFWMWH